MNVMDDGHDEDHTVPPRRALRFEQPIDLYREIPEIALFTKHRPFEGEDPLEFLYRLRGSTTPEDAITYSAFAPEPTVAISWGLEAVRSTLHEVPPDDAELIVLLGQWLDHPTVENRWRVMQTALFAPRRSAIVYLGLAVGWSGGALAPNDPVSVPRWRAPKAVNAGVLRALGQVPFERRSVSMARILDLAVGLFRV
ncbi:hypothetical protein BC777_3790 [Yoonia maricola]|uniref:Uncharacterized protein n=1 Tax=Yoonia maricola TaxID=420999 RepID=A0A2M8W000_9RHOB|nr:hypothetical protein [Yoonia maricola]PJI84250.1 hypothetical protein BC777_3790 [Yoonia maricola]